jgi:hypothetical protein
MAQEKPIEPVSCYPTEGGGYVLCCQAFQDGNGPINNYCTFCRDTKPPSECTDRVQTRDPNNEETSPAIPPTEGISDDPQAGEDRNPSIPPTEGVLDETENNDNSGNDNENSGTPTNTIPRKGGSGSGLDTSTPSDNTIVQ